MASVDFFTQALFDSISYWSNDNIFADELVCVYIQEKISCNTIQQGIFYRNYEKDKTFGLYILVSKR